MKLLTNVIIISIVQIIIALALAYPTMLIWNDLMPYIFKLPTLSFWQTFGLMVLIKLFFNFNQQQNNKSESDRPNGE